MNEHADSTPVAQTFEAVAEHLDRVIGFQTQHVDRIYRQLLITLHTRDIVTIERISEEARELAGRSPSRLTSNPNEQEEQRFDEEEHKVLHRLIRAYACKHLVCEDIDDQINVVLKREEARSLADVANLPAVSYRILADPIKRFSALPLGDTLLDPSEMHGIRVALTRHFVTDDLTFIGVAKNFLRVRDYNDIVEHIIGDDSRMGKIGGKAGGMLLAHRILEDAGVDAGPDMPVTIPDSYFLRSDVIEQFLDINGLTQYRSQKYKNIDDIKNEYPLIKGVFRNSTFPVEIVHQLRDFLEKMQHAPLIVRSSSLLEDRFNSAFSGKYASIFVPNQGPLEVRLRALLGAIGEVYASTLAPDPILYRQKHNLIDYVEEMATLIQPVIGRQFGPYFVPAFAGVAFSRNEYRWSPRIKREDGFLRLVMGLGTRAVDRVGGDYPRMVALGAPTVRPESGPIEIIRNAQRRIDVINLERNRFDSITLPELLKHVKDDFPMLDSIVSTRRENELYTPPGTIVDAEPEDLVITFDKLLKSTPFAARVQQMLQKLEEAFGFPVDIEFACDGEKFYVLQCRAQHQAAGPTKIEWPAETPKDKVVFSASRFVRTALVADIEYVVYVNSATYHQVATNQRRLAIARAIGKINDALKGNRFILVGPGRWGSNDIRLGIRATYSDINNARMLIEVARERAGYVPELSFGTHFFQDLVEDDIAYLPLYPDEPGNLFDDSFFTQSENHLSELLPKLSDFSDEVRVIHVPSARQGAKLQIVMDGERDEAIAYLK